MPVVLAKGKENYSTIKCCILPLAPISTISCRLHTLPRYSLPLHFLRPRPLVHHRTRLTELHHSFAFSLLNKYTVNISIFMYILCIGCIYIIQYPSSSSLYNVKVRRRSNHFYSEGLSGRNIIGLICWRIIS